MNHRSIFLVILILATTALLIHFFNNNERELLSIQIKRGDDVLASFEVETAIDLEERKIGLMNRDTLPEGQGMLFFFDPPTNASMWMKNVLFPLDFIFIDARNRVVYVEKDVPPCNTQICPTISAYTEVAYVLELNAGNIEKYGFRPGDLLVMVE